MRELVERGADTRCRDSYVRSLRKTLIVKCISTLRLPPILSCPLLSPPSLFLSLLLPLLFPQGRTALAVVEEKLSSVAEVGQRYDLADEHQAIRDFLRGRRSEEGGGGGTRTHMTVVREH